MVVARTALIIPVIVSLAAAQQVPTQQAPPQAPPARDFGRQLWTNTRGLVATDNLIPLILGSAVAGGSALLDDEVQGYFGDERRAEWIGTTGNIIGNAAVIGGTAGLLFLTSYHTDNQRFRAMSFDLTQGFIIDTGITAAIKAATRRERPDKEDKLSFPSGHASNTAMAATVISHYYPKAAIPAYLVAGFTAFSRIEKNRHWLSDTVAGALQGYIIGRTVVRGRSIFRTGRFQWYPNINSRGLTVNAEIRLGGPRPAPTE